jgi:hypothetical protein
MASEPASTIPLFAHKRRVHSTYTEETVQISILAMHSQGKSLRAIAKEYGYPIIHTDIERILQGVFPVGRAKRYALHLPPVCPECLRDLPRSKPQPPAWVRLAAYHLAAMETSVPYPGRIYTRRKL